MKNITNKNLKFGQVAITSKGISMHKEVTEVVKIEINKVAVSDRIPCNDWRYALDYQTDKKAIIRMFIKTSKGVISYDAS